MKAALLNSRCRRGSMAVLVANAYDTWATAPYQLCMSVRLVGVGNSRMDSRNLVVGRTPEPVTVKPMKLTSSLAKLELPWVEHPTFVAAGIQEHAGPGEDLNDGLVVEQGVVYSPSMVLDASHQPVHPAGVYDPGSEEALRTGEVSEGPPLRDEGGARSFLFCGVGHGVVVAVECIKDGLFGGPVG